MPNICSNDLVVVGSGADQFYQDCLNHEGEFSFNTLVSLPEEEKENWYDWQVANWGTKWDLSVHAEDIKPDKVIVSSSTAWAPPVTWVQKVAPMYPHLEFTLLYEEGGMCFAGRYVQNGDDILEDHHVTTWDEYKDFCIEEMDYDPEFFEELEADM